METLSTEEADQLVVEHMGWTQSIAKSVARAWNLDWELDGLDGAAMEALIFCARRFQPDRGVPFKGYARRRIHEASTEAARESKGWRRGAGTRSRTEKLARQVSADLFDIFPELRNGQLPYDISEETGTQGARIAIQQLLIGASVIATKQGIEAALPDDAVDYKRLIVKLAELDPVHQNLIWGVYWEGNSLRSVASSWDTDELNVIREHKVLIEYMQKLLSEGKAKKPMKVRPGLKPIAEKLKTDGEVGQFSEFLEKQSPPG